VTTYISIPDGVSFKNVAEAARLCSNLVTLVSPPDLIGGSRVLERLVELNRIIERWLRENKEDACLLNSALSRKTTKVNESIRPTNEVFCYIVCWIT